MVVCDWQEFFDGGDGAVDGRGQVDRRGRVEVDAEIACATHVWATTAALMYRRGLVEKIGGFREDLPVIQDARFLFDAAYHGARFAHSAHVGARYRISPQSLSRRDPARFWRDALMNGKQIETLWRKRQALTSRQMTALADIYNGAAHGLFRAGDPAFREALAALRACGLPVGRRNRLAELLSDIAGHRRAVRLGIVGRNRDACYRHASTVADLPIGPGVASVVELMDLADAPPVRIAAAASADVLHVPYTYFPDAVGGTEVYVAGLAEALRPYGVHSAIAAPGEVDDCLPARRVAGVSLCHRARRRSRPSLWGARSGSDAIVPRAGRAFAAADRPSACPHRRGFRAAGRGGGRGRGEGRADLSHADRQLRARHDDVDGARSLRRQARSAPLHRLRIGAARCAADRPRRNRANAAIRRGCPGSGAARRRRIYRIAPFFLDRCCPPALCRSGRQGRPHRRALRLGL